SSSNEFCSVLASANTEQSICDGVAGPISPTRGASRCAAWSARRRARRRGREPRVRAPSSESPMDVGGKGAAQEGRADARLELGPVRTGGAGGYSGSAGGGRLG